MDNVQEMAAPGHVFQPELKTGIKWEPGQVELWHFDLKSTAQQDTKTPYEYWYNLEFLRSFPQVTHWWFRSGWTQQVRVSIPAGMMDSDTAFGYIQFIDEEQDGEMWSISTLGGIADVDVPLPPLEVNTANLPLRTTLARLILDTIAGSRKSDEWTFVTSLVQSQDVQAAFPTTMEEMPFRLHNVNMPMRQALCNLQGLTQVA